MSEANGNGQQPQQAPVMMMPPTQFVVAETQDRKNVVIGIQTIYGGLSAPIDPNQALKFARDIRAKAKELNSGLVIARPQQHVPPGTPMPGGAIDLSALRGVVDDDDDDQDELAGEDAAPAATAYGIGAQGKVAGASHGPR